jgi:hypothetical protein
MEEQGDLKPWKVKAVPDKGFIYLYIGEEDGKSLSSYSFEYG